MPSWELILRNELWHILGELSDSFYIIMNR